MNGEDYLLIGLGAGALVGGLIGWLWGCRQRPAKAMEDRLERELREQVEQRTGEAKQLRDELVEGGNARSVAEAREEAAQRLLAEERRVHEEGLKRAGDAQSKALNDLREAFKALSSDALERTQPEFLRLANETLSKFQESAKGDLAQRQQTIATLVKPLEEQLKTYQQRLAQSDTMHSSTLGELKKHLETLGQQSRSLSSETLQLRRVLSSNQARGKWGEETLRRVVESAGMSIHCDFTEQAQGDDGKPDLIVQLPGNRVVIVDAKVPDFDFLEGLESSDPGQRRERLAAHASKLRTTIKGLAEREYPGQFPNALGDVILFLPAESLFSAALEGDPELIIWAQKRRILLATPSSLIAILRSVSLSWQQHAQNENAQAIAEAAQEFFNRVARFTEHFEGIRSGLERANHAFNDAVGSYERMVRPSGERLVRFGAVEQGRELADVPAVATRLRDMPVREPAPTLGAELK